VKLNLGGDNKRKCVMFFEQNLNYTFNWKRLWWWWCRKGKKKFHYTCFVFPLECHEWSAAPISAYWRRGPRSYFCSECCTGGESIAVMAPQAAFNLNFKVVHILA